MVILALETATRAGSLALVDGNQRQIKTGDVTRTHSERLPQELLRFAGDHGYTLRGIDVLTVVTGPGSFTGLRIGLAAIQGLAMVTNRKVIPVPTMEALAHAWRDANPRTPARLVTCLDGARGDVFYGVFETSDDPEVAPTATVAPKVDTPDAAVSDLAALGAGQPLLVIGDGLRRHAAAFAGGLSAATRDDRPWNLALGAALVATRRVSQAVAPHALRPVYVRRPDAVLARERARAREASPGTGAARALAFDRLTKPDDLAAVAELQRRSFAHAWGAEAIRWELDHSQVARLYTVRAPDRALVGYCACWIVFDELHINSLAVDPAWRRQGVARRLMDHVLRDAAAAGARSATLEVRQSNEGARALYEGLGFRVEGVRRDYYQDPREDALILWHRDVGRRFAAAT